MVNTKNICSNIFSASLVWVALLAATGCCDLMLPSVNPCHQSKTYFKITRKSMPTVVYIYFFITLMQRERPWCKQIRKFNSSIWHTRIMTSIHNLEIHYHSWNKERGILSGVTRILIILNHKGQQATVLDARASRGKWPAQFMSHWYGILLTE